MLLHRKLHEISEAGKTVWLSYIVFKLPLILQRSQLIETRRQHGGVTCATLKLVCSTSWPLTKSSNLSNNSLRFLHPHA